MTDAETSTAAPEAPVAAASVTPASIAAALGPARWLLFVAIIVIPFNDLPYLESILRDAAHEAALFAALPAMALWLAIVLKTRAFEWPKDQSFAVVVVLLAWIALSAVFNLPIITASVFKGRTGLGKLAAQGLMLCVTFGAAVFIYNIGRHTDDFLIQVRRFAVVSFLVAGTYSVLEIAYLYNVAGAAPLLEAINPLFHRLRDESAEWSYLYHTRLRSVSAEPSVFAMYAAFAFPWLVSYAQEEGPRRWLRLLLLGYLGVMLILTQSRTAYAITLAQVALLLVGRKKAEGTKGRAQRLLMAVVIVVGVVTLARVVGTEARNPMKTAVSLAADEDSVYYMSNLTRTGVQYGTMVMAADHPLAGVGFGQAGFHIPAYLPQWASISPETAELLSPHEGTPWPPSHGLYVRMSAETGIPGLLLFLAIWGVLIWRIWTRLREERRVLGASSQMGRAVLAMVAGVAMGGFNTDSIRLFSLPVALGCAWWYLASPLPVAAASPDSAAPADSSAPPLAAPSDPALSP
jgi:O-antigen ligase